MDHVLAFRKLTIVLSTYLLLSVNVIATEMGKNANSPALRIVALSPHLTEIVFALGKGEQLVGVSDYSDYPPSASSIKSVASYEGANIAEIIRLRPTHILVWRGGNKDADIEKIKQLNISVYESKIDDVNKLLTDIQQIGDMLNAQVKARLLIQETESILNVLAEKYKGKSTSAVYYLSTQPLVGLGNDKWLNSLLALCGIDNIYVESSSAYPQLQMSHVIRSKPTLLIAASNSSIQEVENFWQPYQSVLKAQIITANPDALHRFTPRAIIETSQLCSRVYMN